MLRANLPPQPVRGGGRQRTSMPKSLVFFFFFFKSFLSRSQHIHTTRGISGWYVPSTQLNFRRGEEREVNYYTKEKRGKEKLRAG